MTHADVDAQDTARWPRLEVDAFNRGSGSSGPPGFNTGASFSVAGGRVAHGVREFHGRGPGPGPRDYVGEPRGPTVFLDGRGRGTIWTAKRLRPGASA